ncbi:MAG TPA: DinB family protein [Pyrinomonadaceae bacterium]|nr:DinB family protein [Pyrinomonadaceae bacterium]
MREVERIADQLRRAHEGAAWHGPALNELLGGVTAAQAAARPVAGAHCIWELVLHVEAWERVALRRLGGDPARIYDTGEDWAGIDAGDDGAWRETLARLAATNAALREAVAALDDARLDEPIYPEMSSRYVTLHGVVQHTLYHAGQVAVLKKALGLPTSYTPPVTQDATTP